VAENKSNLNRKGGRDSKKKWLKRSVLIFFSDLWNKNKWKTVRWAHDEKASKTDVWLKAREREIRIVQGRGRVHKSMVAA
jgi:hypothetical protein